MVEGPRNSHYLKKSKNGEEPLVLLANNRTLIQKLVPAATVPQLGDAPEIPAVPDDYLASGDALDAAYDDEYITPRSPRKRESPRKEKRHRTTKAAQWVSWQRDVIPKLVPVWVHLWYQSKGLRSADRLPVPCRKPTRCACERSTVCTISVVQFTSKSAALVRRS